MNVVWTPGKEFKNLLTDAEFNLVASRNQQAAVIKAIKAGETSIDLTDPDANGGESTGGSNQGSGGQVSGDSDLGN